MSTFGFMSLFTQDRYPLQAGTMQGIESSCPLLKKDFGKNYCQCPLLKKQLPQKYSSCLLLKKQIKNKYFSCLLFLTATHRKTIKLAKYPIASQILIPDCSFLCQKFCQHRCERPAEWLICPAHNSTSNAQSFSWLTLIRRYTSVLVISA